MKVRVRFKKLGMIKFISHLDMIRMFSRAFKRAGIPVKWSQGFNPNPLLSIAVPLSVGLESEDEVMDLELEDDYDLTRLKPDLQKHLPQGIEIIQVTNDFNPVSIFRRIESTDYQMIYPKETQVSYEAMKIGVEKLLNASEVMIPRKRKKKGRKILIDEDIRPLINSVKIEDGNQGLTLFVNLSSNAEANLRPDRFLMGLKKASNIDFDGDLVQIRKLKNYDAEGLTIDD